MQRDLQMDMAYEEYQQKVEAKKLLIKNPLLSIIAVFLILYTIKTFLFGRLDLTIILWDAIILGVIWRLTNKEKKDS